MTDNDISLEERAGKPRIGARWPATAPCRKRFWRGGRCAGALIALLLLAAIGPALHAEPVLLRLSLQDRLDNPLYGGLTDFKKAVEARTEGAVQIQIFDRSQFYNDYQVPSAVATGAIEMGLAPLGQYAGEIPATGVFLQPFLFNFDEIIRAAAAPGSEIRTLIDGQILSETGARVLWWQRYGSPVLLSRGKPMLNPATLADRKVRAYDDLTSEVIKLCGGTPHVMTDLKQSEAFDINLIDANLTSISSIKEYQLWQKADFVTRIRLSEILYGVIINEDVWQSLAEEHRVILAEEAGRAEKAVWDRFAAIEGDAYAFAAQQGMQVSDLPSDDLVAWRACSSAVLESYMARAGEIGTRLMSAYARLRLSPCCNRMPTSGSGH